MAYELEINYTDDAGERKIVLTAVVLEVFKQVAQNSSLTEKKGEELAAAIIKIYSQGQGWTPITRTKRYLNGQLNDGPNGEPAVNEIINSNGKVKTPLEMAIGGSDQDVRIEHRIGGVLHDAANGEAAWVEKVGDKILYKEYYTSGKLNDPASGEPAVQKFPRYNGQPYTAQRFRHGELIAELTAAEIYEMQQARAAQARLGQLNTDHEQIKKSTSELQAAFGECVKLSVTTEEIISPIEKVEEVKDLSIGVAHTTPEKELKKRRSIFRRNQKKV